MSRAVQTPCSYLPSFRGHQFWADCPAPGPRRAGGGATSSSAAPASRLRTRSLPLSGAPLGARVRATNLRSECDANFNGRRGVIMGHLNDLDQYAVYFPHIDDTRFLHPDFLEVEVEVQARECVSCHTLEFNTRAPYCIDCFEDVAGPNRGAAVFSATDDDILSASSVRLAKSKSASD